MFIKVQCGTLKNPHTIRKELGMKFPGVVAVLCVVPSGLVLHIGITSCTFPPWAEMSKKNRYEKIELNNSYGSYNPRVDYVC